MNELMDALNEAAKVGSQQYYKTAQKNLTNIQNMLRPFLTGAQEFTAKDLDNISTLLNDQSVAAVLGKNDKKALKAIQNANGMIKNKKAALAQTQQPDEKKPEDAKAKNPQGDNAANGETAPAEKSAQPEQKGNAANIQIGDVDNINLELDNLAKTLGKSKDDIIAYIKTL